MAFGLCNSMDEWIDGIGQTPHLVFVWLAVELDLLGDFRLARRRPDLFRKFFLEKIRASPSELSVCYDVTR